MPVALCLHSLVKLHPDLDPRTFIHLLRVSILNTDYEQFPHAALPNPNWLTIYSRGWSCQLPGCHRPNSTWPLQLEVFINVVHSMQTFKSSAQRYNITWRRLLPVYVIIRNNQGICLTLFYNYHNLIFWLCTHQPSMTSSYFHDTNSQRIYRKGNIFIKERENELTSHLILY